MGAVLEPGVMLSQTFARCLCAYFECSAEMQQVVLEMARVVSDPQADQDERDAAAATISEILFPSGTAGELGVDLEESEAMETEEGKAVLEAMDEEEATFASRVGALMEQQGMTQAELAQKIGVGQPAVSMMLARQGRPQLRTVVKIAEALRVSAEELWPSIAG
jgi:DNA-binding XRE family transcriptional regulator